MLTITEAAQAVMDRAAIVAGMYWAIAPQQQVPLVSNIPYVRKWGGYTLVTSGGSPIEYSTAPEAGYNTIEFTLSYPQFDQQTRLAILKYQNVQDRLNETENEFNKLAAEWKNDRRATSSTTALSMHPAYQLIIGMGEKALPFIFADLQRGLDHWFWALRAITRENPVSPENRGNMQEMANAWLSWGREKGYVPH